jgi:hypothetical protein
MPDRGKKMGTGETIAREIHRQLWDRALTAVREMGPPAGARKLSEEQQVRFWWLADPKVDVERLVLEQGYSAEEATLAKYPYRKDLLLSGKPKLVQRVEFATRMKKLRQKYLEPDGLPEPPATDELDAIEAEIGTSADERLVGPLAAESNQRYGGTPFAPSRPTETSLLQLGRDLNQLDVPAAPEEGAF